ncbi:MAG: PTS system mannose/fructose/sorbose family transporter subunit IID [Deltaproteobacteria bacterium]|jgi:mannose/fructose/N-acetylgalactosamine-specific phosphotransferase system component IID|nr:PTS system mannose/fructose/sorbose family transporter subunit IID [Deltaproteobacteria bacterium]
MEGNDKSGNGRGDALGDGSDKREENQKNEQAQSLKPESFDPPRLLRRRDLAEVAFKIFILETLWNPRYQQSLGLLTIIDKALKITYAGRPQELKQARQRNLDFFNTNPVASGLVIGAVLRLEERQAAGDLTPTKEIDLVQALGSCLAAEGDQLFWQAWLPLCCLTAALVVALTGWVWAPLIIPLFFCSLAWPVRFWGVFKGYKLGADVFEVYHSLHVEFIIYVIQWLWMLILSVLTSLAILKAFTPANHPTRFSVTWILLSILLLWLYKKLSFGHNSMISYALYPILIAFLFFLTTLFA